MDNSDYSKWVLEGLHKRGIEAADAARITGLALAKIDKISKARAAFTDAHLEAIEHAAGMTAGQLVLLTMNKPGKKLTTVIDALADCRTEKPSLAAHP